MAVAWGGRVCGNEGDNQFLPSYPIPAPHTLDLTPPILCPPVITDGVSANAELTQNAADAQKAAGIIIIAIGVGSAANEAELQGMASIPKADHWTNLGSYEGLTLLAQMLSGSCIPHIPAGATTNWGPAPSPPFAAAC